MAESDEAVFHNLLEPPALLRHFEEHPPERFTVRRVEGLPGFSADFDLLTTVDERWRKRLRLAQSLLRWPTRFAGTTVSEYALLPRDVRPEALIAALVADAQRFPLLIVKDLPSDGALVGDDSLRHSREFLDAARSARFVVIQGQALAYVTIDFTSIDEYLRRLSHARRKNIRRKLRSRAALEVEAIPTGDGRFDDEAFVASLYDLYRAVYDQSEVHFDLLTLPFFRAVFRDASLNGTLFTYRAGRDLIGWNFCVIRDRIMIDKYIGLSYPASRHYDLYTVSWMENLQFAAANGCRLYVAGWTDPEVKRQLGAAFTFTLHAVHLRSRILRALLKPLQPLFENDSNWHSAHAAHVHS